MEDETTSEMRDQVRDRKVKFDATSKYAGGIVVGAVVLLALIRAGFRGRAY